MTYGVRCISSAGVVHGTDSALGMVFVGRVLCSITSGTQVIDYPSVPFGHLRPIQVGEGNHTWVITNVGGYSRLTFTWDKKTYQKTRPTALYVFASNTLEPDYGINALTDGGERLISTIYPNARFVQKLQLTGSASKLFGTNSWVINSEFTTYTPTTPQNYPMIFWSLPTSANTSIWWQGESTLASVFDSASGTLKSAARMRLRTGASGILPTDIAVKPEAFLFEAGPMSVSTEWGARVFDGDGRVMYDAATPSMVIPTKVDSMEYHLVSAETTYSIPTGYTPAFFSNAFMREKKQGGCVDGYATLREDRGMFRRDGGTLYSALVTFFTEAESWDCRETATDYIYGNNSGLFLPVINAQLYGGAAI